MLYYSKFFFCFISALIITNVSLSQQKLFIPRNVQSAYDNGTRSLNGEPGSNYWQNFSEYKIKATIDPANKILYGYEDVVYHNNSPDTLDRIVIKIYQNIFKYGSARDFSVKKESLNNGVTLNKVTIEDSIINLKDNKKVFAGSTVLVIKLDEPLAPNSQLNLSFDWNFIIPSKDRLRMGAYDSTSFFIAYWYPQVAVYDDIDGWDTYAYTGYQEMYNDFSNFDVEISVPNNFGVWATGTLNNAAEVLNEKYLEKFILAENSDTVISIIDSVDLKNNDIFNNEKEKNVWKYFADNITDFAFGMSDHYLWDRLSVAVDSSENRRVNVNSVYKKESEDFYKVAEISANTVKFLSFEMPGVPFPFPSITVFNGSGGMEFPMIVNDGSASTWAGTVGVTSHEISHQYFPFYMGTNEKKYAFMDEGWAVKLPFEFQERNTEGNYRRIRAVKSYERIAGTETEMPPMIPSVFLTGTTYRTAAYNRPAIAYHFLHDILGDELFKSALQEFINKWHGKHPIPYDMFFSFNEAAGKNLNWYFKPWFFERGYPDLAVEKVEQNRDGYKIVIKKNGIIPVPLKLKIIFDDETEDEIYHTAAVWENGINNFTMNYETDKTISQLILGDESIPDVNSANDTFTD